MLNADQKGTIAIAFVREALRCAERRGLGRDELLQAARIPASALDRPDGRVSPQSFATLWLDVARRLDDEFFGLDRRRMKLGSFAALCRSSLRCANLQEALQAICALIALFLDDTRIGLAVRGVDAWLLIDDAPGGQPPAGADRAYAHETLFVLIHGLICWLIDRRIPIEAAEFSYPVPDDRRLEYPAIFSPTLHFSALRSAMRFPALYLQAPIAQNARSADQFLRGAPATFLLKYRNERSLSSRVRRLLKVCPPAEWPSFEQIAARLDVSASHLRRALERDGTSFLAIKDALRRDLAITRLIEERQAVATVADELGYAEASAFHRAFKKWTGLSPSDYRDGAVRKTL